jgi:class 3 adenylate cyclase
VDQTGSPLGVDDAKAAGARFQIQISRGLLIGFGGLVFLAVVAVLAVGLWSARQNTFDLLRDKSETTVALVLARIEQYLVPAEDQLIHLGRQLENGSIDAWDDEAVGRYLSGALAATPQVRSVVLIRADERMVFALRQPDGVVLRVLDVSQMPVIMSALDTGRTAAGFSWGEIVYPETANLTLLNARYAVHREGRYLGTLAATVRADTLSTLLEETAEALGGSAFVIYDYDFVLAHPRLIDGTYALDAENPLPSVADVDDALMTEAWRGQDPAESASDLEASTGIRIIDIAGEESALLSRGMSRYGEAPWLVGVYFPAADLTDELARLRWAAIAGGIVLLVALVAAYFMARTLSRPFSRLAVAAEQVRDLSLERVQHLPGSLFREVTTADHAFNAMVGGLRWFETYVPRNLVHRLVRQGGDAATSSVTREATVMFTDIVGFTRHAETMTAPETARFLNDHFATLSACVEAEGGTIDKFIGDAVMAFWGAPEEMPDHAARACRAALAMRAAVEADNARRRGQGADPIRVRVGLHTGSVIVGNIGAPGRINYTIVGDTVNTANRLEQLGKEIVEGEPAVAIVISGDTARAAGDAVQPIAAGTQQIRGREEEVEVYRL